MNEDAPDCTACGACCFSRAERYVRVHGEDYARLGDDAASLVTFFENEAYMRMENGHCAALRIVGQEFLCSVYEKRPTTCRALDRGSPACAGERHAKSERPLIALRAHRAQGLGLGTWDAP